MNASGNDSTVIEPVAMPVWIRYFGAVSYLLVALLSLTVNGLLLATFVKVSRLQYRRLRPLQSMKRSKSEFAL